MKKFRKTTRQETAVAEFSRHSISGFSTFHPKLFGNGREPADMVILVGRALILLNMHEGKSYFADLVAHNLNQARDRISEWKGGKPIRGETDRAKFDIMYSDIDYIHVISIVDGPHAACCGHDLTVYSMDEKVRLITTMTSSVLKKLASLRGGARDLIGIALAIEERGVISEADAILLVEMHYRQVASNALSTVRRMPNRLPPAIIYGKPQDPVTEQLANIEKCRMVDDAGALALIDLSWNDVYCIVAFCLNCIADIEWSNKPHLLIKNFADGPGCVVVVSKDISPEVENIDKIALRFANVGASFLYRLGVAPFGIFVTCAMFTGIRTTVTEKDLASISTHLK